MTKFVCAIALSLLVCTVLITGARAEVDSAGLEGTVTYGDAQVSGARVTVGDTTV